MANASFDHPHQPAIPRFGFAGWFSHAARPADGSFRWIYPFTAVVLIYAALAIAYASSVGLHFYWSHLLSYQIEMRIFLTGAPFFFVAYLAYWVFGKGESIISACRRFLGEARVFAGDWRRWYELLQVMLSIKLCLLVYGNMKQWIPALNPGIHDAPLDAIDSMLHFGFSPVDVSLSLFSQPLFARSIDFLYVFWYVIKAPFLLFFFFHRSRAVRWHFFTCYLLMWTVGGTTAILLPSLGPCFIEPAKFALLETPHAHHLQAQLWTHYQEFVAAPASYQGYVYEGIAAFPSLHVGLIALFTMAVWPHRRIFWAMVCFSVVIQIGSVLLGWHYAIDGYFGALLAAALFHGSWRFFKRLENNSVKSLSPKAT